MHPHAISFELGGEAEKQWNDLNKVLRDLAQSERLWHIDQQHTSYDWKRNAGAIHLLSRQRARLIQRVPDFIDTNIRAYALDFGKQRLYFLPDCLCLCHAGQYTAIHYTDVAVDADTTTFIEEEQPPQDAEVVSMTWKYVNKDGGPDGRFVSNRPLPVLNYGVIVFEFPSGLVLMFHASNTRAAETFASAFNHIAASWKQPLVQKNASRTESQRPNERQPGSGRSRNCYEILGVKENCSLDEISAAYRRMAKKYHPDIVNHLAPEFQALAEERMKEINRAYDEIKKLKNAKSNLVAVNSSAGTCLVALEGFCVGKHFILRAQKTTIGRDMVNDISLAEDRMVSRNHAYILMDGKHHVLHDNGSTNGTFINNGRLKTQILRIGDLIQVGTCKFRYE
jgi:hypothetical protein